MKIHEAIQVLTNAIAAETASRKGLTLILPAEAMDRLRSDATWLSRYGVAEAGDTGTLFMHSPAGVVEIRQK